jgi:hypothetical protein
MNNNSVGQICSFNFSGFTITVLKNKDLGIRMNRYNQMQHNSKHIEEDDKKRVKDNIL